MSGGRVLTTQGRRATGKAAIVALPSAPRWRHRVGTQLSLLVTFAILVTVAMSSSAEAHFIYTCPGYSYNRQTHAYTLPSSENCSRDPYHNEGTHQWAAEQAKNILFNDGYTNYARLLQSTIRIGGSGVGRRHLDMVKEGVIAGDTRLAGCTSYGKSVGWPIGDHMLNPYRHFGIYSYNQYPDRPGWHGWLYPRTGDCARSDVPRVRSNSAAMAKEFFSRAQREWRNYQPGNAMYNLGVALHVVQDATVPSHVHPEYKTRDHYPRVASIPRDVYPAWANQNKIYNAVQSGGYYGLPSQNRGVKIYQEAGGWAYWMASIVHPYFYYDSATSPVSRSSMGCNVTYDPEGCLREAKSLVYVVQRGSAGFIRYFFGSVGYPPQ